MSLSAEESRTLQSAQERAEETIGVESAEWDEAIWLAAKNWAFEQAAKVCESLPTIAKRPEAMAYWGDGCRMCAEQIRLHKDQHG